MVPCLYTVCGVNLELKTVLVREIYVTNKLLIQQKL